MENNKLNGIEDESLDLSMLEVDGSEDEFADEDAVESDDWDYDDSEDDGWDDEPELVNLADMEVGDDLDEEEVDEEVGVEDEAQGFEDAFSSTDMKDPLEMVRVSDIDQILTGVKFERTLVEIPITSIVLTEQLKRIRSKTVIGLTATVADMGRVLNPIDVLELPKASEDDEPIFSLISGVRRFYGATRNNMKTIPAWVWKFQDIEKANKLSFLLGLVINKQQQHSMEEVWNSMQVLEQEYNLKPAQIERLFPNLRGGDAMKLKDVALGEYDEPRDELFSGEWELEKAYKHLQKLRKEEDELELEDSKGIISETEVGQEVVIDDDADTDEALSHSEVMDILEMDNDIDMSSDDIFSENADEGHHQDRKGDGDDDLSPEAKNRIKFRDKMLCRVCCSASDFRSKPTDEGYLNPKEVHIDPEKENDADAFNSLLTVHHLVPVHAGGTDDENNLVTLCLLCHHRLHVMEKMRGFMASEESFKKMDEKTQHDLLGAYYFAKFAIEAGKRKGYSRKEAQQIASQSLRHKFPGQEIGNDTRLLKQLKEGH